MSVKINELMDKNFETYSEYVNYHRAIPHFYDGLKPVHRRIMYACYMNKWFSNKPLVKVSRIVGETMGRLHSHGDTSIYGALVQMAQPHVSSLPLIEGEGNFGGIDSSAAAARYIEAKLSKSGDKFFDSIEKDTIEWVDNYDNTLQEPLYLPAPYPQLLVHPTLGIGVGMSSSIPQHNLEEVLSATKAVIDNENITTEELIKNHIKGPDFPSGCDIVNKDEIADIYTKGSGSIRMRAKFRWENNILIITNFPNGVAASKVEMELSKLQEEAKFLEIRQIINTTAQEQELRLIMRKKDDEIIKHLCWNTSCETTFSLKLRALRDNKALVFSLKDFLYFWIEEHKTITKKEFQFDLKKLLKRQEQLEGVLKALSMIDKIIKLIKESKNRQEAKEKIMKEDFSELQANFILDLKLARLVNMEIESIKKELEENKKQCEELNTLIKNEKELIKVVKNRLSSFTSSNRECQIKSDVFHKVKEVESTTFYARQKDDVILITDKTTKGAIAGDKENPQYCALIDNTFLPIKSPKDVAGKGILLKGDAPVIHVSTDGIVKRTTDFKTSRRAKATKQKEIHSIFQAEKGYLLFTGENGEKAQFDVEEIPVSGRGAKGVIGVKGKFKKVELINTPIKGVKDKRRQQL